MGWIRDGAYDHEGWVANVLADGRVTSSSTGGGVIVHDLTPDDIVAERQIRRYDGSDHLDIIIPWEEVVTWQLTCQCGWTGDQLPAYTNPKYGTRDCPEDVEDRVFAPAWDAHVAPFAALTDLGDMTDQLRDLEQRITDKVHLARTSGASWAQIGRATHLTKQGAQQRWNTSSLE
jgi:hypothetical protein